MPKYCPDSGDAESSQRGYLLTGEERYVGNYRTAIDGLDRYEQAIQDLTADNPNQVPRIIELRSLIASKLGKMAERIDLRKRNASVQTIRLSSTRGKQSWTIFGRSPTR